MLQRNLILRVFCKRNTCFIVLVLDKYFNLRVRGDVMIKRVMAVVLSVVIAISATLPMFPAVARADNRYEQYYEDYRIALSRKCIALQRNLLDTGEKQYGLLFRLRLLTEYMMYCDFMIVNGDSERLNCFSEAAANEIYLSGQLKDFNSVFGTKSDSYRECVLNDKFTGTTDSGANFHGVSKQAFRDNLCKRIPEYLDKLLTDIQDDVKEARGNSNAVKKAMDKNGTMLTNVYMIYEVMDDALGELKSYRPYDEDGERVSYSIALDGKTIKECFDQVFDKYPDLVDVAKLSLAAEETDESIEVDLSRDYIENLSDAIETTGGVEFPKSPKLSLLYYAIMAASSVYVPLQSYAGNSEFQDALKSLTNDEQIQSQMVEFYSAVKDLRKPLYKREFDDNGIPTGTAKIMTIQDLIDDIENGNSGALCTVLGKFKFDSNTNAWLYSQDEFRNNSGKDYEDVESNSKTTIDISSSTDEDLYYEDSESEPELFGVDAPEETVPPIVEPVASTVKFVTSVVGKLFSGFTARVKANSVAPEASAESTGNTSANLEKEKGQEDASKIVEDTAVFAYSEVTDDTKLSEALYMYGVDYFREVDNLTSLLMYNAVATSVNLSYIANKTTRYIYVNCFGDIVTEDNLIIFPGIANPAIYRNTAAYNPYTAVFMNSYPMAYKKGGYFKLTNKNSIGKYIIVRERDEKAEDKYVYYAVKTSSIDSIKVTDPIKMPIFELEFASEGSDKYKLLDFNRLIFGTFGEWDASNEAFSYTPLTHSVHAEVSGNIVFPYVPTEDGGHYAAKAIASNMYRYLTTDKKTAKEASASKVNDNYVLHYFIINGVSGTNNPKGYERNSIDTFEKYEEGAQQRFLDRVKSLSDDIAAFTYDVKGVIGLRESLQNPILGKIMIFCRENLLIFLLIMIIILVYFFAKMHIDFFAAAIKLFASLLIAYACITVIPSYLPLIFNVVINEVSENLTYKILALKTEGGIADVVSEKLDKYGNIDWSDESLTLYKAGTLKYNEFASHVNADKSELVGGNTVLLNDGAGIFAEGDAIKVSIPKLFSTLQISPAGKGKNGEYLIKAYKTVSNNIDYYTPFYMMVDGFVNELDKMQSVYNIPKSSIVYSNGVMKDNFLVYSFVNSPVFLTPGSYNSVAPLEGLEPDDATKVKSADSALAIDLENVFGKKAQASDFMRISSWIYKPTETMKKTLWYKTMEKNGFYHGNGKPDKKRIDDLITHVNYHTKRFIFAMEEQVGRVSDETMIKLIALRAVIDFNQQISEFGSWVYPFSLNYGDFSLGDVSSAVFTSDYSKYTAMDFSVVDFVGDSNGWFNLIVTDVLLILMFLLCNTVQILVPVMYILMCVTVIAKLLVRGDTKLPIKGFVKCIALVMAGYTMLAVGLALVEKANGKVFSIYVMLFVCLLLSYLLFLVVSSLASNLVDMGNTALNVKLQSVSGIGASLRNISVNRRNVIRSSDNRRFLERRYRQYAYNSGVSDRYRPRGSQYSYRRSGQGPGSQSNFGNQSSGRQNSAESAFDYSIIHDTLDEATGTADISDAL